MSTFAIVAALAVSAAPSPPMPLRVSPNGRFLIRSDGTPFFYLADTAWELFHRLARAEAERYLRDRAAKGFTVLQAVALAELDGTTFPNPYGHLPLIDQDPARPNEAYFEHVDWIVDRANALGLTVGFLPTWGRYWHDDIKDGRPLFTPENSGVYGEWIGRRYRDKDLIWILGGDRAIDNETQRQIVRAMALGLKKGDDGAHLRTFHPRGGSGSWDVVGGEDWVDFHMRQNGHSVDFTNRYDNTRKDYGRTPIKPIVDGEPVYEDHPIAFNANNNGHSIAADVRRPLYWDLFSGACGHTYGHHSVWQFWQPGRAPINNPLMPWSEAIAQPGAGQMQHGRRLMESRPFLARIPDDSVIVTGRVPTAEPGAGRYRFVATRDQDGAYAMVYAPVGRAFTVRMDAIKDKRAVGWWFDPRNGRATRIGEWDNDNAPRRFTPPNPGEELDWILVLDAASKRFPAPGTIRRGRL